MKEQFSLTLQQGQCSSFRVSAIYRALESISERTSEVAQVQLHPLVQLIGESIKGRKKQSKVTLKNRIT